MVKAAARTDNTIRTHDGTEAGARNSHVSADSSLPPRFPSGWFSAGFSHEIRPGQCVSRRFMGQEIVVFRTSSGRLFVFDAYCPHLGAHLGHGGTVRGEVLRCPFHGFTFDGSGACAGTPYPDKRTPAMRVGTWPVREVGGAITIYYDPHRRPPTWELGGPTADGRWRTLRTKTWRFRGHPQETSENAVDFGHLTELHKFSRTRVLERPQLDGPRLTLRWVFTWSPGLWLENLLANRGVSIQASSKVTVDGLGFSMVETAISPLGLYYRQLVLATPVDHEHVDLRTSVSLRRFADQGKRWRPLHFLGEAVAERLLLVAIKRELERDIKVWRAKAYLPSPKLAHGDGPIGPYRVWARQFYQTGEHDDDIRHA